MKPFRLIPIYGLGGEALSAPENTSVAYWSALGCGAAGLALGVRLTKDGKVICSNNESFGPTCGNERLASELDWSEIETLDAGYTFQSTTLGADNQPDGIRGDDFPWRRVSSKKRPLRIQLLSSILVQFARRCHIIIFLPDGNEALVNAVAEQLEDYGLGRRVYLAASELTCQSVAKFIPNSRLILTESFSKDGPAKLKLAESVNAEGVLLEWESVIGSKAGRVELKPDLREELETSSVEVFLHSKTMPFAAPPEYHRAIEMVDSIGGIIAAGVERARASLTPPTLIVRDDFMGDKIDRNVWTAGYSHANRDTNIFQDNSLIIDITEGGSYSGGAAVCTIPFHGEFDARVKFCVRSPQQATTFELAAICIDPGYFNIDNTNLNSRRVNLTFDVHGAPPYASSERDEDDGFRCGWNNGFNLTRIDSDWNSSSANMYNKYGRDVGDGSLDNPYGVLRLVRSGKVFSCFYKDKHNAAWVSSGAMLVQNMADDVFLRLAAKHWAKGGKLPQNRVKFNEFEVYQF